MGERPGDWSGTPSGMPLSHVPHATNVGAGHPLLAADASQWGGTAAAASPYGGPGYEADRVRGGSGGGGVRYPQSPYDTTRGEGEDQGLQVRGEGIN